MIIRLLVLMSFAAAAGAAAQDGAESARSRLIVAHNQLGLLQYCKSLGFAGEQAVADAARAVARLPAEPGAGDAEQAEGARGVIAFGTSRVTLQASAAASGITLQWRCAEAAAIAAALAAR